MAEKIAGVELAAQNVLKRAVELDQNKRFQEAVVCYREGIGLLMDVLKTIPAEKQDKKKKYREKIDEYMKHAEQLKDYVKQQADDAKTHEQIHILADSIGHGYNRIFSRCFDAMLSDVEVNDAYIRQPHQVQNFLRFCEMCVKSKSPIKMITLNTGCLENNPHQQAHNLDQIASSLSQHGVTLRVNYSTTLHDREIRFNNGWVVQIGRGLDYFKQSGKFTIGSMDMDLRMCNETTIDVFHSNSVKTHPT